jgi:hypothetical protein
MNRASTPSMLSLWIRENPTKRGALRIANGYPTPRGGFGRKGRDIRKRRAPIRRRGWRGRGLGFHLAPVLAP